MSDDPNNIDLRRQRIVRQRNIVLIVAAALIVSTLVILIVWRWKRSGAETEEQVTPVVSVKVAKAEKEDIAAPVSAQSVKHLQNSTPGGIANGVWVGDTLYLSGQLPSPNKPADRASNTPASRVKIARRRCSRASICPTKTLMSPTNSAIQRERGTS